MLTFWRIWAVSYTHLIIPTMQAGPDYEGYLLGTSFARPILAKRVVEIARAEGADAVCHGTVSYTHLSNIAKEKVKLFFIIFASLFLVCIIKDNQHSIMNHALFNNQDAYNR